MLVDSHCHLNFLDLADFNNDMANVLAQAKANDVQHFLCVCVELNDYPKLEKLASEYPDISISVGIHPNTEMDVPITSEMLCDLAKNPACIAIGETGLDYYRTHTEEAREVQRSRFKAHVKAALKTSKPLIIHTRQAAEDTIALMAAENAQQIGGVMHCFAESLDIAYQAMDLNFYISFSGIVTFKNATALQDVARKIPLDRILIETDSPYLAPVPYRGKQNHPALVKHVAEAIAELRGMSYDKIAEITTNNFYTCFKL
ncbi:deoxyribonuclease belonging to the TatD DNAse family [Legionella steigerwaltii]|uniref:Deoxyribonuclease belonging to the TatD DNAse family n=1 Tax=Legionella steigerwaltii TaxID=460 RepID=A0A378LAK7_9GAMM|nr:TatD family hydrolase [Legionella steigerwaltii]KTD77588.1 deoxyribonuclease belonging to the TatD DNAse family protein [Legionella steigerwaltii]STY22898.1 deoxyribonuclease belonging to the TatD DNAse family [Legionella steigerwaltii]